MDMHAILRVGPRASARCPPVGGGRAGRRRTTPLNMGACRVSRRPSTGWASWPLRRPSRGSRRRSTPRATSSRSSAARCATRSSAARPTTSTSRRMPRPTRSSRIVKPIAEAHWDIGRAFGTIGAKIAGETVEITTYRADAYDGDSRKPDGRVRRQPRGATSRGATSPSTRSRCGCRSSTLVDPSGGVEDLARAAAAHPRRRPSSRFGDDPLRMLRAARFSAQLGFDVDHATRDGHGRARATLIDRDLAERVQRRAVEAAADRRPACAASVCSSRPGSLRGFLPEIPALRLEVDEHHHHKDVYEHSLTVLRQAIDYEITRASRMPRPTSPLRLAALLHDIGKPATRKLEPGGGGDASTTTTSWAPSSRASACARCASTTTPSHGRRAADRAAPAVLRLRRGRVDRLGRAPLRARCRRPARAAAHPHAGRRDDAQPTKADRLALRLRRPRASASRSSPRRRSWRRCARARRQPQSWRCSASGRAARSARPTGSCSSCGSTRGRSARMPRLSACARGGPARGRRLRRLRRPASFPRLTFGLLAPPPRHPPPRSTTCERVTFRRFEGLERDFRREVTRSIPRLLHKCAEHRIDDSELARRGPLAFVRARWNRECIRSGFL